MFTTDTAREPLGDDLERVLGAKLAAVRLHTGSAAEAAVRQALRQVIAATLSAPTPTAVPPTS